MEKLVLHQNLTRWAAKTSIAFNKLPKHGMYDCPDFRESTDIKECDVVWGFPNPKTGLTMEVGFFHNAFWLDRKGQYGECSFHDPEFLEYLKDYEEPVDIIDSVLKSKHPSKYDQPRKEISWKGNVAIAQVPSDRAILVAGTTKNYYGWLFAMCQRYKSSLFIKAHPQATDHSRIALESGVHGSAFGHVNMSILDNCNKVLVYSSTCAVDAWMRDKPVEQHAISTFSSVPNELGRKFVNFLMWNYCMPNTLSIEEWLEVFRVNLASKEPYPLPVHYSWGYSFLMKNDPERFKSVFKIEDAPMPPEPLSAML